MELAFWHIFISHSLRQYLHRTEVPLERAILLYILKLRRSINIGKYILEVITRPGEYLCYSLSFTFLITHFYMNVYGVEARPDSNQIEHPMQLMDKSTYNDLGWKKNIPMLLNGKRSHPSTTSN
ncbi:hypothetical protein ACOSP7_027052 [Xanthoceras sorbifolium]